VQCIQWNGLLGAPLVALPWFVGIVAGQFGVIVGVGVLGLAPILVLLLLIGYQRIPVIVGVLLPEKRA
jgi:hypothetical protein